MKNLLTILFLLMSFIFIFIFSCSKSNKDKVIGLWERKPQNTTEKYIAYSFEEDDNVLKVTEDGKKYKFGEGAKYSSDTYPIKMQVNMTPGHTSNFNVKFLDDETISIQSENPGDPEIIFTKKKE